MNATIVAGSFLGIKKTYRSKDGKFLFAFDFVGRKNYVDIYCHNPPPLNGRDPNPRKTHLFSSGKICFWAGKEPKTQAEAERRAREWAEYWLEYRRTGEAQ